MIIEYLETSGKREGYIRRNFSAEEKEYIKSITPWITGESLRERVYCILNNITETPKCLECGKNNNFLRSGKYSVTCSRKCSENEDRSKKIKETKLEKYGSETFVNPEKAKETTIKKYGVEHTSRLKENRLKAKKTNLEKYGNENYNNIDQIKETCIEKYGVDNVSKAKEIKDKISINLSNHYSNRRIENDYSGVLYILKFIDLDLVKIGITNNFDLRSKLLKFDFGEFDIIKLQETNSCFTLEKEYHDRLSNYRVCLESGCGRTEFFNIECLNEL